MVPRFHYTPDLARYMKAEITYETATDTYTVIRGGKAGTVKGEDIDFHAGGKGVLALFEEALA